eukprot:CAMPEP_0185840982 /NCGR_PEP_ID=MMETSP1353-20130828/17133_1 /TAXON_ID=1077150 /ORGANISM="Erythrolobus australicus, Strain CCMP3124" /LENGTH=425 /DNA_ID=CAMNT_0028540381 /DNA_START=53 /DNA_END=1326 /DNA_ORIENTATION=-
MARMRREKDSSRAVVATTLMGCEGSSNSCVDATLFVPLWSFSGIANLHETSVSSRAKGADLCLRERALKRQMQNARRGDQWCADHWVAHRRTRCVLTRLSMESSTDLSSSSDRYMQRGVSSGKEDVHSAIAQLSKGLFPRAFCKIVPDHLSGDPEYCIVMHADGAGTKSSLAYLYWKTTGDLSVWRGIAHDAVIMNVDDLACVGATDNILLSSTIGRNKNLISGEVLSELIAGTEQCLASLRANGVNIVSTGGETADLGDLVRTVVVDSTVVARMRRDAVISNDRIAAGDVIVGLASSGPPATFETAFNSGMGSNGLTSARHDVLAHSYAERFPESFDSVGVSDELAYCGSQQLTNAVDAEVGGLDIGKLLLSPTRTYAPVIARLLQTLDRSALHGIVHCSGGAQTKVLHFVDAAQNLRIVKDDL